MTGAGICVLLLAVTCASEVHPVFNPVAPMDICFLTCICLLQVLQIHTRLCDVVGSGFVSTSPAFMRSRAKYSAGLHGRLSPKKPGKLRGFGHNLHSSFYPL